MWGVWKLSASEEQKEESEKQEKEEAGGLDGWWSVKQNVLKPPADIMEISFCRVSAVFKKEKKRK